MNDKEKGEELIPYPITIWMTRSAKKALDEIAAKEKKRLEGKAVEIAIRKGHECVTIEDVKEAIKG